MKPHLSVYIDPLRYGEFQARARFESRERSPPVSAREFLKMERVSADARAKAFAAEKTREWNARRAAELWSERKPRLVRAFERVRDSQTSVVLSGWVESRFLLPAVASEFACGLRNARRLVRDSGLFLSNCLTMGSTRVFIYRVRNS